LRRSPPHVPGAGVTPGAPRCRQRSVSRSRSPALPARPSLPSTDDDRQRDPVGGGGGRGRCRRDGEPDDGTDRRARHHFYLDGDGRPQAAGEIFLQPGRSQPSFSVAITDNSAVVASRLPLLVVGQASPQVIGCVSHNKRCAARVLTSRRHLDAARSKRFHSKTAADLTPGVRSLSAPRKSPQKGVTNRPHQSWFRSG
jgi:hypothetical protein